MPQAHRLQRLLVATDLSTHSDKAFNRAVMLAREDNARLTVLHVIPDELNPERTDTLKSQAQKSLEETVAQAMALGELDAEIAVKGGLDQQKILKQVAESAARGDTSVEVRLEAGSVYDIINETAAETDADLVVCGAHRKLMIGDEWRGSTMERVLRFGGRPVLIVKSKPVAPYQNLVVAVDFSAPAADALEFAFTAFPGAKFTLVNAIEGSLPGILTGTQGSLDALDRQRQELTGFVDAVLSRIGEAGETGPDIQLEVRQGTPLNVLQQYVTEHATDLVVVGTHGRTGLRRAFLGSVAERLIAMLPTDILAVRPQGA